MTISFCNAMRSMAKLFLLFILLSINIVKNEVRAQTYPSTCGLGIVVPDNSCAIAPLIYKIPVGGVAGTQLGVDVVLARVDVIIGHSFDADLQIYLQSPLGPAVELSVSNGLGGNNYGDPLDVSCASVTSFSSSALLSITAGTAPFIGSFRPQGDFSDFDDGSDPNGEWSLIICDGFPAETGTIEFASLHFTPPCEQPIIDAVLASSTEAKVDFTSFNSGATYTIEWGVPGFSPGGIGSLGSLNGSSSAGANSRTITGLSSLTEYEIYLSEDCGELQSLTDGPYYFVTTKQNDICFNAVPVSCGVLKIDSTTTGATDVDAPGSCGGLSHDESPGLWFVYMGNGADVTVSLCGLSTNYNTRIGVFEGPCADLTCVGANDDFCGISSEITFTSESGREYYIYISGSGGEVGTFEMSISCSANLLINEVDYAQPGTDGAEFIELLNTGSTTLNLENFSLILIDGTGGGASLYNSYNLPDFDLTPGDYFVLCGDSANVSNCDMVVGAIDFLRDGSPDALALSLGSTQLDAVSYNGNTGAPYTEGSGVGLEDDSTAINTGISRLPDGVDSDVNNSDFSTRCISPGVSNTLQSVLCTVANDSCAHATVISPALGIPFDNREATTDGGGDPLCSSGGNDTIFSDIWFLFIPDCNGNATFSTIGSTYDTKIAVYQNSCGGTILDCNDDTLGTSQSIASWTATAGTSYLLRLGGFSKTQQDSGLFDLTLAEIVAPTISCGPDKVRQADPGVCTATVNPVSPGASDNCSEVIITNDFTFSSSALGSYPLGTTIITWTATDASGNTATCQQNVTVSDNEAPSITCPFDIIQTSDADTCGAFVSVPLPLASDNCTIDTIQNDFNGTPNASGFYPVGATSVFWVVEDESGSSNGCMQTITITDNQKPSITCPVVFEIPSCDSFGIVPVPLLDDNCGVASFINDYNSTSDASDFYNVGTTSVKWTVTDLSGNTASCSMSVVRNLPPTAAITPDPVVVCKSQDQVLYGNPVIGSSGIASHLWNSGSIAGAANLDSVILNVGVAGLFGPVKYTVTDSSGCSATDSIFITILDNPTADIVSDTVELCEGNSVQLNGNPSGGNGALTNHSWTGDTVSLSSTAIPNPDFNGSAAGSYSLNYTIIDSLGCSGSDSVKVIVNSIPSVAITTGSTSTCEDSVILLNANIVPGSGSITSQGWSGDTIPLSSTTIINPSFSTSIADTYNLTFSVSDDNLCSADDNVTITVNSNPVVSFTGLSLAYCLNDAPDTLLGTPSGGSFFGPGTGAGPFTDAFNPSLADTGTHNVTYAFTDGNGCSNSESQVVTVNPLPVADAGSDASICSGETIILTASGGISYQWSTGALTDTTSVSPTSDTSYQVTATNGFGCKDDAEVIITVNPFPATTFTGLSVQYCLNDEPDTLIGTPAGGVFSGPGVDTIGVSTFDPGAAGTGTKTVSYTFVDGNGCIGVESVVTSVLDIPAATAEPDTSICPGGNLLLTATGGASYSWSTGASTNTVLISPTISADYIVTVTGNNGCSAEDTAMLNLFPPAVADAGLSQTSCSGSPVTLTSTGGVSYSWSTGDVGSVIVVAPIESTTYFVTALDANGCSAGDSVIIDVLPLPVAIPGADKEICEGDTSVISVSGGNSYLWSDGITTDTRPASPLATIIYMVTVSDANTCADTTTVTVTVHLLPSVSQSGLDQAYCNNDRPDTLTGTPLNGFFGGPAMIGNVFSPTLLSPGTYTITYTFIDSFGCQASDSSDVLIYPAPLNTFIIGLQPEYCVDITANQLTGSPPGGSFSGAGISGDLFISYYAGPGIHDIVYTYDSGGLCIGRDTQTVMVHPLPVVSITDIDSSYCSASPPDLLLGVPPGGTFTGLGMFGDMFYPDLAVIGSPSFIYYEYFDSNGCAGRNQASTIVYQNPKPIIINPGTLCVNDGSVQLTGSPADGLFSGPGITNNILETSAAGVGIHAVEYSVTDNSGCSGDTSIFVAVNDLPAVTLSGLDSAYCVNAAVVSMSGTPPGGNYSGEGVIGFTFNAALAETGGPYPVSYTYTDSNGCTASDTQFTSVLNSPFLVISGLDPAYCIYEAPVPITVLPTGGTLLGAGVINGMFDPRAAGTGTHIITYLYDNVAGCVELERTFVTVDACVGINNPDLDVKVSVFPNPTEGKFTLEVNGIEDAGDVGARFYNVAGKVVLDEIISLASNTYSKEFDLSKFPRGVYYLKLNLTEGIIVRKVIVQ